MATLTIRNLDEHTKAQLRIQAARQGRQDGSLAVAAAPPAAAEPDDLRARRDDLLDEVLAGEAERSKSERWRWLGGFPREEALLRLARSRALVLTSRIEGGPNVLCEAALLDRPILATCIDGVAGILPSSHEGLFEPGDERGLCALLLRLERDAEFLERLLLRSRELAESCAPERERLAFEALLAEDGPR